MAASRAFLSFRVACSRASLFVHTVRPVVPQPLVSASILPVRWMAGHSKWHNIKHAKAAQDQKRSKIFQKLFREIVSACRMGGANIDSNPRLFKAVENARASSMPKKNIESALRVGSSPVDGSVQVFEVNGPGGVSVIVEGCAQDRRQIVSDVRRVLNSYDAELAKEGSLLWMFDKRGIVEVARGSDGYQGDPEELAIEVGAENVTHSDNSIKLYCGPLDVNRLCSELKAREIEVAMTSVDFIPNTFRKDITEKQMDALQGMVEELEDIDEITRVTLNLADEE